MSKRRRVAERSEAQAMAEFGPVGLPAIAELQPQAHASLAFGPYTNEYAASADRNLARASEPRTLAALVRWARWAYRLEPPIRIHTHDIDDEGVPRFSGQFLQWIRSGETTSGACATDPDGYYTFPLRCALFTMHGPGQEDDAAMKADFCLAAAVSNDLDTIDDVAERVGLKPHWVVRPAAEFALRDLWSRYAPMRGLRGS